MSPHATNDAVILAALTIPGWFDTRVTPRLHRDPKGCLIWTGSLSHGYSQVSLPIIDGRRITARVSRVVWYATGRSIPEGYVLDHDGPTGCKNKACVEPDHLQAVTISHNIAVTGNGFGAVNARKLTCPRGHVLAGDNLMRSSAAKGRRSCLACNDESSRLRNETVREAAAHLGMGVREYVREYGWSIRTAYAALERRRAA